MRLTNMLRRTVTTVAPLVASALAFAPAIAHAQSSALERARGVAGGSGLGTTGSLASTIGTLIVTALGTVGAIFLIITIYAGFLWMTSAGEEEKVTKAKQLIISGVIGMAIILGAMVITSFVVDAVTATSGTSPGEPALDDNGNPTGI